MSTALPRWFWGANQHGKNFVAAGDLVAKPGVGTGLHPDRPNFLVGASPRVARVIQYPQEKTRTRCARGCPGIGEGPGAEWASEKQ